MRSRSPCTVVVRPMMRVTGAGKLVLGGDLLAAVLDLVAVPSNCRAGDIRGATPSSARPEGDRARGGCRRARRLRRLTWLEPRHLCRDDEQRLCAMQPTRNLKLRRSRAARSLAFAGTTA